MWCSVVLHRNGCRSRLDLVRRRGRYTELALFGSNVTIDFEQILIKEIKVTGAVSHRPSAWRRMFDLIERKALPVEQLNRLITATYPLAEWQLAFERAASKHEAKIVLLPEV